MISFEAARALILERATPMTSEFVALAELRDRVFSSRIVCPFDVPMFHNSQVDGYAVRSGDEGARRIIGEAAAGGESPIVGPGEAARIFTGAPVPSGADAVIMQEDVRLSEGSVSFDGRLRKGQFVRRQGEEIILGTEFDFAGLHATPPLIGLAASFGLTEASVFRRPRVAIVATGNELVQPGETLRGGQIYASNLNALESALESLGITASTHLVRDDLEETQKALETALAQADVVITSGGVSVGDHDHVRPALASLGVKQMFWQVSVKPGKPVFFGTLGPKLVFGLPGNPVSALVTFYVFVRPALRRMMGLREAEEDVTARLATSYERKDLRYEFLRATLVDGVVTPVPMQGSHMQTGLAFADALLHLPEGVGTFRAGDELRVTPIRWSL